MGNKINFVRRFINAFWQNADSRLTALESAILGVSTAPDFLKNLSPNSFLFGWTALSSRTTTKTVTATGDSLVAVKLALEVQNETAGPLTVSILPNSLVTVTGPSPARTFQLDWPGLIGAVVQPLETVLTTTVIYVPIPATTTSLGIETTLSPLASTNFDPSLSVTLRHNIHHGDECSFVSVP